MTLIPPEWECLRAALPRWVLLDDSPLLLLSAAALPVLRQCGLITVYRCTHQCGERSNAAFGTQSAAVLSSLAPHDSKARLLSGRDSQGFMAKPCTPHLHCAARAVLRAVIWQCAGSRGKAPRPFSQGLQRGILSFEKESIPLLRTPARCGNHPPAPVAGKYFYASGVKIPFSVTSIVQRISCSSTGTSGDMSCSRQMSTVGQWSCGSRRS